MVRELCFRLLSVNYRSNRAINFNRYKYNPHAIFAKIFELCKNFIKFCYIFYYKSRKST